MEQVTTRDLIAKNRLDDNTVNFNGHGLALYRDDRYLDEPTLDTGKRMKFYADYLAHFQGVFPCIYPLVNFFCMVDDEFLERLKLVNETRKVVNYEERGRVLWAMDGCNYKAAVGGSLSENLVALASLRYKSIGGHVLNVAMMSSERNMQWYTYLDEYEKLVIRMKTPKVVIDNVVCPIATLMKVDGARRDGILLDVVQVLAYQNLSIKRLTFHQMVNGAYMSLESSFHDRSHEFNGLTVLELTGTDRVGLLSEVFVVLVF
ncbi:hypothetical protein V6N12_051326 [Hibiscus sabdariffa]|uniref:ACT domain-containing protein ACR n=1 Tax=Hibiscus sabdariffa TaxID=183260 RepID=A0ABR2GF22_9ROSI